MRRNVSVWRGLVAGIAGGLAGSLSMAAFQRTANAVKGRLHGNSSKSAAGQSSQRQQEPATVQAASAIAEHTVHRDLTPEEKKAADPVMHYSFGAITGAAYGVAAEFAPAATAGAGLPFGAAVWLAADEIAVPAMGLAKPAWEYPLSTHFYALASHFVYGLTTELSRMAIRNRLG